jgi:murein DD-endopeptidase MepM/ murein hydrolase activator NlpD
MATARASRIESRPKKKTPSCRLFIVRRQAIREVRIRPWLWGLTGLLGFVFFSAYLAATGYLVFRDDLLAASLARTARQQQAYEDRIASLRADIDRLSSRQLLNQEEFDERLSQVASRQAILDRRKDILADLGKAARKAGLVDAENDAAGDDQLTTGSIDDPAAADAMDTMALVESSLDYVAADQVAMIDDVAAAAADRSKRIATVLKEIGRPLPRSARNIDAIGGPFEPIPSDADPETFRDGVKLALAQVEQFTALHKTAAGLPLTTPMSKGSITSRFGVRTDPFRGRPAMHTGIDFRSPTGQPARATAAGKVVSTGYNRGYGYMVEIDHGGGITTRFAHLSKIIAKKGQSVAKGDVVGNTGSTGRSTGPHLHYEIRVNGKAIDPMTFIRAGERLKAVL